jgi:hypothetical protein
MIGLIVKTMIDSRWVWRWKEQQSDNEDCKGTSALILGNLQGDQSGVQLRERSPVTLYIIDTMTLYYPCHWTLYITDNHNIVNYWCPWHCTLLVLMTLYHPGHCILDTYDILSTPSPGSSEQSCSWECWQCPVINQIYWEFIMVLSSYPDRGKNPDFSPGSGWTYMRWAKWEFLL